MCLNILFLQVFSKFAQKPAILMYMKTKVSNEIETTKTSERMVQEELLKKWHWIPNTSKNNNTIFNCKIYTTRMYSRKYNLNLLKVIKIHFRGIQVTSSLSQNHSQKTCGREI